MAGLLDTIKSFFEASPPEGAAAKEQAIHSSTNDQAETNTAPSGGTTQQTEMPDIGTIFDSVSDFLGNSSEEN